MQHKLDSQSDPNQQPDTDTKPFLVQGQVRQDDGTPLVGVVVRAYDRDLRSRQFLGQCHTDQIGHYEIRYSAEQFQRSEKGMADLVLFVVNPNDEKDVLLESPTFFNAPIVATIDLVVDRNANKNLSEYERLVDDLQDVLEGVALADLTKDDISFLTNETGISEQHLTFLMLSARLGQQTELPSEAFYGFARESLPTDLAVLLTWSSNTLRQALKAALKDNIIPARLSNELDEILERLQQLSVKYALQDPQKQEKTPLGALLDLALPSAGLQRSFVSLSLQHDGSPEDFWKQLRAQPEFQQDGLVDNLQFTLQMGMLTRNHTPLVQELQALRRSGTLKSPRDLAKFDAADWLALINKSVHGTPIGLPADMPGKDDAEKAQNYAHSLAQLVEEAFPTPVIAYKIQQENKPANKALVMFFANNPDFEFGTTNIDAYLNGDGLQGVEDQDSLSQQLKGMQRVFKLTPYYEEMSPLLADSIDSAHKIVRLGKTNFTAQYSDTLGQARAADIYHRADSVVSLALNMFARFGMPFNTIHLPVTPPQVDNVEGIPNWETLFGLLELCDCEECRSVYGPAAYLVDILAFLQQSPSKVDGKQAIDILFERRPDIGDIELSCENANTLVPYIDLVNEVLENAVSPRTAVPTNATHGTAEELGADPEHLNIGAYTILLQEVYPWILPFNLWVEEARAYLERLGSSRYEVLSTFQKSSASPDPELIACEYLKIAPEEYAILSGAPLNPPRALREFYGYRDDTATWVNPVDGSTTSMPWHQALAHVREFLARCKIRYTELLDLLKTRFLNQDQAITLDMPEGECDLDSATLQNLDETALAKVHRFLRLWRKSGWSIRELDGVMHAPGVTDINIDGSVQNIVLVKQLQADLNMPLQDLLTLWSPIDTTGDDSLYSRLFQNKATLNPVDPVFELSDDHSDLIAYTESLAHPNDPGYPTPTITEHAPAILAALRLSAASLAVIRRAVGLDAVNAPLNLKSLSLLYRFTRLARILNLSFQDFATLQALVGPDFDPFHDPTSSRAFVDKVRKVRTSGFSIAQLNYLYRHISEPIGGIAPSPAQIAPLLVKVQEGLTRIAAETMPAPDPTGELLRSKLTTIMDGSQVEEAIAFIDVRPGNPPPRDTPENRDSLSRLFGAFLDSATATPVLLAPPPPGADTDEEKAAYINAYKARAFSYVLTQLMTYLRTSLSQSFIKQTLGEAFKLDSSLLEVVLESREVLQAVTDETQPAMADWLLAGNGLLATYTAGGGGIGTSVRRLDLIVNFDWGTQPPDAAIPAGPFSVRWTGKLQAQYDETYTFYVHTDGHIRLLVNGQSLIEITADHVVDEYSHTIDLHKGQFYDIVLEYSHGAGNAVVQLSWSSPSTVKAILPQGQLYTGFDAYTRLYKATLLLNTFRITAQEITYLSTHRRDFDGFDLNRLPLARLDLPEPTDEIAMSLFKQWERLYDLFTLRDSLSQGQIGLIDVFGAASLDDALDKLQQAVGWDRQELATLSGGDGFNLTIENFRNEIALIRLQSCLDLRRRLGVSAQRLLQWAQIRPDADTAQAIAQDIKKAAKAAYSNEQWTAVAKPTRDLVREKQRDALVYYLMAHPETIQLKYIDDPNDLSTYYLIDVQMGTEQTTSRIKQAMSSVQWFVQRCLMNLERDVSLTAEAAQQWQQWMKYYRVWEDNRKVFLYPENWIHPELRDDKTAFFKDLENELLQNDVTAETAEAALLNYLEKLDTVARLDICGMYHQLEGRNLGNNDYQITSDVLHVFGKTRGDPQEYYYRQWVDGRYWTPWEKVAVDIAGDHLIPAVYNRRLYLFWPVFTEKTRRDVLSTVTAPTTVPASGTASPQHAVIASTNSSSGAPHSPDVGSILANLLIPGVGLVSAIAGAAHPSSHPSQQPSPTIVVAHEAHPAQSPTTTQGNEQQARYWETRLAWSEYKNQKWTAKKLSDEFVEIDILEGERSVTNQSQLFFKAESTEDENDELVINCYKDREVEGEANDHHAIHLYRFRFTGCHGRILAEPLSGDENLRLPDNSQVNYMTFEEKPEGIHSLRLDSMSGSYEQWVQLLGDGGTPSLFNIVYPHQFLPAVFPGPFFYEDDTRTFFVTPQNRQNVRDVLRNASTIDTRNVVLARAASPSTTPRKQAQPELAPSGKTAAGKTAALLQEAGHHGAQPYSPADSAASATSSSGADARTGGILSNNRYTFLLDVSDVSIAAAQGIMEDDVPDIVTISPSYRASAGRYRFETFYHPYVCLFIKELNRKGIEGLLQRWIQINPDDETFFEPTYLPVPGTVYPRYPVEDVDFRSRGAYAQYNWELFFHIPLLIAARLSTNQHFEDAQKWFHYIFDPTDTSRYRVPNRYWRTRPFFEMSPEKERETIQQLMLALDSDSPEREEIEDQVEQWRAKPFNPHLIARLRITAYQKTVVMQYLDNLITWADQRFRQDLPETVEEAAQLYILAAAILGKRPESIPAQSSSPVKTYRDLEPHLDLFSNAVVGIENLLPSPDGTNSSSGGTTMASTSALLMPTLYFCIPKNDKLLKYWATIEDRLGKIRHGLNIDGIARQLPLYGPEIDPDMIVRATAAGLDIGSIIDDINTPLPFYRFTVMVQKALELCADIRALGASLLAALEKKDAEALALLRSEQEICLLKAVLDVKKNQKQEAQQTLEGLQKYKEVVQRRYDYYHSIQFTNPAEIAHLNLMGLTAVTQGLEYIPLIAASGAHEVPNEMFGGAGFGGSPLATVTYGGSNVGSGLQAFGSALGITAAILSTTGGMAATMGSYSRRWEEWKLQEDIASKELEQVQKQIDAATTRLTIAQQEQDNHTIQIDNAQAVDDYMHSKFTNQELYDWMVAQTSALYFQSYQLAYDIAKRAEKAFRFERGLTTSDYIQFGYWDSLKKGLLAGEHLHFDLKRMEMAYMDQNRREYEITKHISLVLHDPLSLIVLKETGQCELDLPEALFDADYPGHYMRRIKNVTLTIPCVTGPYTSISCTLTLLRSQIRIDSDAQSDYMDDSHFVTNFGMVQSIAMSHAQNDSGMFELNFRDERYLPFEGSGVISRWRIELPKDCNAFDFATISDVVLRLNYTARDGGEPLQRNARSARDSYRSGSDTSTDGADGSGSNDHLLRFFSAKHEFANDWYRFLHPSSTADRQILSLDLSVERFPYLFRGMDIQIHNVDLFLQLKNGSATVKMYLVPPSWTNPVPPNGTLNMDSYHIPHAEIPLNPPQHPDASPWQLVVLEQDIRGLPEALQLPPVTSNGTRHYRLNSDAIDDIFIVCRYSVQPSRPHSLM